MNLNQKIIDALNVLMKHELTAIDIYFLHSRIFQNRGLNQIAFKLEGEWADEVAHVKLIVDRILFLRGTPDFSARFSFSGEQNITAMLEEELRLEYLVGGDLKDTVVMCEESKDFGTRQMLLSLLDDSEKDHIHWLEKQLKLIAQIGEKNYIQSMMTL